MRKFKVSVLEKGKLSLAAKSPEPWEFAGWKPIKRKLKNHLKKKTNDRCCYCRRSLANTHNMSIDIEHVLPKKLFPKYVFSLKNLSVACKRCNMGIKNQDRSFFSLRTGSRRPFRVENFSILHPNLSNIDAHLLLQFHQVGTKQFIKYHLSQNPKAKRTYEYFKLREIETGSLDSAQGLRNLTEMKSLLVHEIEAVERLLQSSGG